MNTYTELNEMLATLDGRNALVAATVRQLQAQAVGYVWGSQDAQGINETDESIAFGIAFGVHAARYALGEIGMRHNIRDAYKAWRATREI